MNINIAGKSFIIREAIEDDLPQLVNVHVTSWNATYPGYHPKPTAELRAQQWMKAFKDKEDDWFCFVVETTDGKIAGFATGNNFYDPELPYKGQLNKIHFYKEYHRMGLGRKLVGCVVKRLVSKGITSMILFADPENPNILFYDVLQGRRLIDKDGKFHGAFGWSDLTELAELCAV